MHVIKGSRLDTWMMLNFPKMVLADKQNRLRNKKTAMQFKIDAVRGLLWFSAALASALWLASSLCKWEITGPIFMVCYFAILLIIFGLRIFEWIVCKRYDNKITKIDQLLKEC